MGRKKVEFSVDGSPVGKARPRHGGENIYTPKKTKEYENFIKWSYISQIGATNCFGDSPVSVDITIFMPIAKSVPKKRIPEMLSGKTKATKKPDIDNVVKAILDALNNIAYNDDKQVVELTARKKYSENPRVQVIISETE